MWRLFDHLQRFWVIYVSLLGVYIVGVVFGAIGVNTLDAEKGAYLKDFLDRLLANQPSMLDTGFLTQLVQDTFIMIAGIWLLGLTVIGTPLIYLIVFTRGFVLGFTVSFIIQTHGLLGIGIVAFTIFIPALLGVPLLLLASGLATIFSLLLIRGRTSGESLGREFFYYSFATLLLSLGSVVVGVTQGYFSTLGVYLLGL